MHVSTLIAELAAVPWAAIPLATFVRVRSSPTLAAESPEPATRSRHW